MRARKTRRGLAWLLVLAMSFSLLPAVGLAAEETGTFTKVSSADELTDGSYILVAGGYAATTISSGSSAWVQVEAITVSDDSITSPASNMVWTVTSSGEGVTLTDSANTTIAPKGGNNNGIQNGNYIWKTEFVEANGTFKFMGVGEDTVTLASYNNSEHKIRALKNSSVNNSYVVEFSLYKLQTGPVQEKTGTPTANVTDGTVYATGDAIPKVTLTPADGATRAVTIYYSTDGTTPAQDAAHTYADGITLAPGYNTIKAFAVEEGKAKSATLTIRCTVQSDISIALAGKKADAGKFLVQGDVTLVDGKNIYLQDNTGGICAYFANAPTDIELGDTIAVTGTRDEYSGLPELSSASYTKKSASPKTLTPILKTITGIADADLCTYVTLTGLRVQGVGEGTQPTLTLSDGTNTIDLYKAVLPTEEANIPAVNDTVTIKAAVGIHSGKFQLRNTKGEEIEITEKATVVADPTASVADRGNVAPGQMVTFSSATEGATIQYKVGEAAEWTIGNSYMVPDDAAEGSTIVIKVKASAASLNDSQEVTITLTVKDTPLKNGAHVVIWNPANKKALSSTYTGNYNSGVDVTLDDTTNKLTGFDRSEVWTVGVNSDGTYTFTTLDGGKKLGMGASDQPLVLDGEKDTWKVMETEGGYHIENAGRAGYRIEWYKSKNNWSTYYKNYDDQYVQQFYAVPDEELPMATVATPVILPASASVTSGDSVEVTIECATADADIYYTTDGSTPTAGSTKYTAAFTLSDLTEAGTTVKAIAVKSGMKDSAVVSKTYKKVAPDSDFLPVTDAAEIKGGGYFVLVPKEYDTKALSTSFAFKPTAVDVTLANGTYAPTLKFATEGDGVSIQYEVSKKFIGYDSQYSTSIQESDSAYKFAVTGPDANGAFRFSFSTDTSRCIAYRTDGIFGAYKASNDGQEDKNGLGTYECDMLVYKSVKGYLYNPHITFGVLNDAVVGQQWSTTYSLEETDVVSDLAAYYSLDNSTWTAATLDETAKTVTVPGAAIVAGHDTLYLKITGTDTRGTTVKQMETLAQTAIKDEPMITTVSPAQGAETGADNLKPTFTATVVNGGTFTAKISITPKSGAAITDAEMTVADGVASYTPAGDLAEGWCDVTVTVTRDDGKTAVKNWSCTVGEAKYVNYFGQLHSHTAEYSDGAGTLADALNYVKNTASRNNVQFVAFTDHSNYFDTTDAPAPSEALYDVSQLPDTAKAKWDAYKKAVADFNKANTGTQVAIAGFEMTWSGGPGHINTFNTPGIVSRNNKGLNNKTNDQGMRDYYSLLSNEKGVESISQFNHPGTTFGTFSEFAYYDPTIDSRITLVEVGNGEGAIGSGGYFPSYSEYTKALDKGWHLAPTNNQDNHKGHWGDSNDARTVVYTTDLSENGIYQAMREMRIYATEDKNLDIVYTVGGEKMGTIVEEVPTGPVKFEATISDPDATDKIGTVEIVTNGGTVVHKVENIGTASYELDWEMTAPKAGYYFLRVTQADKDIAVTAPVWLGKAKNVGMSELTCGTAVVVKGEAVTFSNQFFNNETTTATLKSVSYTLDGAQIGTAAPSISIGSMGTYDYSFSHTFTDVGKQTVTLTAVVEIGGEEKTLTSSITVDVKDPDKMIYVGIDGSHYNEYVSGNYKDSMGNFTTLAADYEVRVVTLNTKAELLAALANPKYKMMVFTAPSRRDGTALRNPYANYGDDEIAAIKTFAESGGTLVLTGWGDYYEHYGSFPADDHMAAQQNKILAAVGSKLRLADDEAKDVVNKDEKNTARLYLTDYNGFKSPLLAGVDPAQVWSQYGGSTVYAVADESGTPATVLPDTVTPLVSGYGKAESDGTGADLKNIDSYDDDNDGYMNGVADKTAKPPKYPSDKGTTCLLTATEEVTHANGTKSLVMVSGGAFMSNFEVKFDADNVTQLGYSNPVVLGNLLESLDPTPVSKISDLHADTVQEGAEFVVEGVVTANTSGYDRDTAFFDCTYVQDETGGINVFPVSGNYQVGQRVRVKGIITSYQGERELTLSTSDYQDGYIKALSHAPNLTTVTPVEATTKDVAEGKYLGQLVKVQGTVTSVELVNGAVQTIRVKDASDVEARLFIDGYITASKDAALQRRAKVGTQITAVGIASFDNTFKPDGSESNRIRIRDRADITAVGGSSSGSSSSSVDTVIQAGEVLEQETNVQVSLPSADATFSNDAKEKLAELNQTKPVTMEGAGLKVLVPAGTISGNTDPADLLVDPAQQGNAVQITLADGSTEIVPFALVTGNTVAYIADKDGSYSLVDNSKNFADVPEDFWGADAVNFVSANELFKGNGSGCFIPEGEMTRAMVVTVLARLYGAPVDDSVSAFPDVPAGTWYTGAVAWAAEAGIVEGDGTNFVPDAPITREALCAILDRFTAYANLSLAQIADSDGFVDTDLVSDWAQKGVTAALKSGLITGKPGQIIDPPGTATRAEVATILQRLVKAVLD